MPDLCIQLPTQYHHWVFNIHLKFNLSLISKHELLILILKPLYLQSFISYLKSIPSFMLTRPKTLKVSFDSSYSLTYHIQSARNPVGFTSENIHILIPCQHLTVITLDQTIFSSVVYCNNLLNVFLFLSFPHLESILNIAIKIIFLKHLSYYALLCLESFNVSLSHSK